MGCKWCPLGRKCHGPLHGIDDLEANCGCDCHTCVDCGSAYCESMGGDKPCDYEEYDEDFDDYEDDPMENQS